MQPKLFSTWVNMTFLVEDWHLPCTNSGNSDAWYVFTFHFLCVCVCVCLVACIFRFCFSVFWKLFEQPRSYSNFHIWFNLSLGFIIIVILIFLYYIILYCIILYYIILYYIILYYVIILYFVRLTDIITSLLSIQYSNYYVISIFIIDFQLSKHRRFSVIFVIVSHICVCFLFLSLLSFPARYFDQSPKVKINSFIPSFLENFLGLCIWKDILILNLLIFTSFI